MSVPSLDFTGGASSSEVYDSGKQTSSGNSVVFGHKQDSLVHTLIVVGVIGSAFYFLKRYM